ncbi:UNVERIFIED_CONTAM: hypothetical protein K2H54_002943 [Gekko kuhli]
MEPSADLNRTVLRGFRNIAAVNVEKATDSRAVFRAGIYAVVLMPLIAELYVFPLCRGTVRSEAACHIRPIQWQKIEAKLHINDARK